MGGTSSQLERDLTLLIVSGRAALWEVPALSWSGTKPYSLSQAEQRYGRYQLSAGAGLNLTYCLRQSSVMGGTSSQLERD